MMKLLSMERWLSGRKRQIANLLYGSKGRTEGSNPSLSAPQRLGKGTKRL